MEHAGDHLFIARRFRQFPAHIANSVEHIKLPNHGDHYILSKVFFDSHSHCCKRVAAPGLPPASRLLTMSSGLVPLPDCTQSGSKFPSRIMPLTVPCMLKLQLRNPSLTAQTLQVLFGSGGAFCQYSSLHPSSIVLTSFHYIHHQHQAAIRRKILNHFPSSLLILQTMLSSSAL